MGGIGHINKISESTAITSTTGCSGGAPISLSSSWYKMEWNVILLLSSSPGYNQPGCEGVGKSGRGRARERERAEAKKRERLQLLNGSTTFTKNNIKRTGIKDSFFPNACSQQCQIFLKVDLYFLCLIWEAAGCR